MKKNSKDKAWIYSTFLLSIFADIYFFPEEVLQWKPLLTLLVLIYWNMALPDKVGVAEALIVGIILDLLSGSLLGLHAFLFVFITYICQRFFYQFRVSPILQQSVILFFLFFIFKMAFAFDFLNVNNGINISDYSYLFSAIIFAMSSSLAWSPIFFILRELRRKKIQ